MKKIKIVDLFCGAGGAGTGMIEAFETAGIEYEMIGVNHWQVAIDTNKLNHAGHYRRDGVEKVSPRELVPDGFLDYLWASPECTNHSRAKGGKPKDEQSRATAWDVLKWPQELYIKRLYIENVDEFLQWGPCDEAGKPIPEKKGQTFRAFIGVLKSLGYRVDWRIMNAADFGAPTNRRRLIIQAVRASGERIVWPEPTHAREPGLFGEKPWVPAREIIDWNIKGKSIFTRKTSLAPNTLHRIYCGVAKYWGPAASVYLPRLREEITRSCQQRKICPKTFINKLPLPCVSKAIEPFTVSMRGTTDAHCRASSSKTNMTLPTITANGQHIAIVEPLFIPQHGGGTVKPTNKPLSTIATTGAIGIVEPFVIATGHTSGGARSSGLDEPISTIVTKAEHCIVEPFLVKFYGNEQSGHQIDQPLGTITTKDRFSLVEGRLIQDEAGNIYDPDILFRMLQPHELAAAMGFPQNYRFAGKNKSDIVKQIGNAVPPPLSKALGEASLMN